MRLVNERIDKAERIITELDNKLSVLEQKSALNGFKGSSGH
jgi:hypothetical protein